MSSSLSAFLNSASPQASRQAYMPQRQMAVVPRLPANNSMLDSGALSQNIPSQLAQYSPFGGGYGSSSSSNEPLLVRLGKTVALAVATFFFNELLTSL